MHSLRCANPRSPRIPARVPRSSSPSILLLRLPDSSRARCCGSPSSSSPCSSCSTSIGPSCCSSCCRCCCCTPAAPVRSRANKRPMPASACTSELRIAPPAARKPVHATLLACPRPPVLRRPDPPAPLGQRNAALVTPLGRRVARLQGQSTARNEPPTWIESMRPPGVLIRRGWARNPGRARGSADRRPCRPDRQFGRSLAARAISSYRIAPVHCRAPCSAPRATPGTIKGGFEAGWAGATPWATKSCHNSSSEIEPSQRPARRLDAHPGATPPTNSKTAPALQ